MIDVGDGGGNNQLRSAIGAFFSEAMASIGSVVALLVVDSLLLICCCGDVVVVVVFGVAPEPT